MIFFLDIASAQCGSPNGTKLSLRGARESLSTETRNGLENNKHQSSR